MTKECSSNHRCQKCGTSVPHSWMHVCKRCYAEEKRNQPDEVFVTQDRRLRRHRYVVL